MCAITGLVACGDRGILERMTATMTHRGPDSSGQEWFSSINSGLGHRRLAILDLSPTGHQPMCSSDGRHWIVFNGEIYNFMELREELSAKGFKFRSTGDTEVLLAAYVAWGQDCLSRLNGMFAFAILDQATGELFAARDQLGIKPLYYWSSGEKFVFASEIKAILQCPFVPREPDYDALATPARFQVSPQTGFRAIQKLPPGHALTFAAGKLSIRNYGLIEAYEDDTRSDAELVEYFEDLLQDAVRLQMISDRPVGTFLSGGLDSSIISAMMRQQTSSDIHAFTIKFSEADQRHERMPDDSHYARQVADQFGFIFHEFEIQPNVTELLPKLVWHLDEPLSDPAAINTFMISEAARNLGIVVLLNGVGGDEIFGGYRKHMACLKAEHYQKMVPAQGRHLIERFASHLPVATSRHGFRYARWLKRFTTFASLPQAERYLASDLSLSAARYEALFPGRRYSDTHFFKAQRSTLERKDLSYLTRMCLNDTRVFLPEHNLTYSDKAAMAASVETRPALTDIRMVNQMFRLRPEQRIRGNTQKYLLKKIAERHLPKEIVYRGKASFNAPLRAWIRGPLSPLVDDFLSEAALRRRAFYNSAFVRNIIDRDRRGLEDNSMQIWTLLTFELWFRTFIDQPVISRQPLSVAALPTITSSPSPMKSDNVGNAQRNGALEDSLYPLLSLYERAPAVIRRAAGHAYRTIPRRWRLGPKFEEFQTLASETPSWTKDEIETYQTRQLRAVLLHAASYCPYYQRAFAKAGFRPESLQSIAQISSAPLLERRALFDCLPELVSSHYSENERLYLTTGGSTGVPVGFYLQKGVSRPKEQAFLEAQWRRAGYFDGARLAVIRGQITSSTMRGRIAKYDATRNWLMLSSYHLTAERLPEYLEALEKFKPDILHAYPSAALQLAEFLERAGQSWRLPLKCVLCGSERLNLPQKRLLERVFKTRVYRWYGHSERVVLAGEGRTSEQFYFWPTYGFVEFGPADEDGFREVIGTSFHNLVMPLIRYRTGDYVKIEGPVENGRAVRTADQEFPWPAVSEIAGREQEFLVSKTGRRISLTAFNMHDAIFDDIYAVQFHQGEPGRAEFWYVPGPAFHSSRLAEIKSGIRKKLGDDFDLDFRAVSETEKTPRGKHKWLVSKLS